MALNNPTYMKQFKVFMLTQSLIQTPASYKNTQTYQTAHH